MSFWTFFCGKGGRGVIPVSQTCFFFSARSTTYMHHSVVQLICMVFVFWQIWFRIRQCSYSEYTITILPLIQLWNLHLEGRHIDYSVSQNSHQNVWPFLFIYCEQCDFKYGWLCAKRLWYFDNCPTEVKDIHCDHNCRICWRCPFQCHSLHAWMNLCACALVHQDYSIPLPKYEFMSFWMLHFLENKNIYAI